MNNQKWHHKIESAMLLVALILLTLLACLPVPAFGQTVGVHTVSHHMPHRGQNNVNPGIYYRTHSGTEAGYYRNSYSRSSFYIGQRLSLTKGRYGDLGVDVGFISGYQRKCKQGICNGFSRGAITPMVAGDYLSPISFFGVTPRLQFAPATKGNSAVIHLSAEYKI